MKHPKIAVIDYGMGNLRSVSKALEHVGARVVVTSRPSVIRLADAIVFPGVGAFKPAMKVVSSAGIDKVIKEAVSRNKPFLGLCLGFQLLFDESTEEGRNKGLGIIPGKVIRFKGKNNKANFKVPHMGWNTIKIQPVAKKTMFKGIKDKSQFYFVHSYYGVPVQSEVIGGLTDYGTDFCSAIVYGKVWACQFHPEKSGTNGLKLLRNFVNEVNV